MAYQHPWLILCQIPPCRRTAIVLFNPLLERIGVFIPFTKARVEKGAQYYN